MRQRLDDLDDALDDQIERAAIIAGEAADDDAQRERDGDADEADRQRNPRAVNHAREHVAAKPVGAEQEQRAAFGRAEQMPVGFEQPPEHVRVPATKEADRLHPRAILRIGPAQRVHVELVFRAVDERSDELTLVEEVDALRRRADEINVSRLVVVGRQELADQDRRVQDQQENARGQRKPVALELPPHQRELGREIDLLLRLAQGLRRRRIERQRANRMRQRRSGRR